ncbi:MAG: N-acetylglucosamine kinase [Alphaproteobacteria bacterium]|nr:MAG: N-acetylglucosamine kinase [Alphaproteobacteria bacterium]
MGPREKRMGQEAEKPTYLVADCGGSWCRVRLLSADGKRLAEGTGGPANVSAGLAPALSEVFRAAREALEVLDNPTPLSNLQASLAVAGLNEPAVRREFTETAHPFASLTGETDAFVAQIGAFAGGDGGLLITGTGACAFGKIDDETFEFGGWGFAISDQGSGARLGHLAVRRALQALDGLRPSSAGCDAVLEQIGTTPGEVSRWARDARPADFGAFAPILFEAADAGDGVARELIMTVAAEVDELLEALKSRGLQKICHIGGLAGPIRPWLSDDSLARLTDPKGDTFEGAWRMLREGTGLQNRNRREGK